MATTATARVFDRVAGCYDSAFSRPIDIAEDRVTARLLGRLRGRVLDLGCGTGWALRQAKADDYVGIDVSPRMIAAARAAHPDERFEVGDMADLSRFRDDSFDAVVSTFGSFSYCLDPEAAAAEAMRVLRPGGRLFVMALGPRYGWRRSHIAAGRAPFIAHTARSLVELFSDAPGAGHPRPQAAARAATPTVRGVNLLGDLLPACVGPRLATAYLWLEAATTGRRFPDLCYFVIVEGTKHGA